MIGPKSRWLLVGTVVLAIAAAIAIAAVGPDAWRRKPGDDVAGEAGPSSRRPILDRFAPRPDEPGQADRAEGPRTRGEPVRIKTH